MDLLIERTARRIESRYRLQRKSIQIGDYRVPVLVRMVQSVKTDAPKLVNADFAIRNLEQEPATDAHMEHKTAQFFLRNLPRVQRSHEEPDMLPLQEDESRSERPDLTPRNLAIYRRPNFIRQWSVNDFRWLQKVLNKTLRQETWTDRFSLEIRETLMKGLWNSNPEPIDIHRPDFWEERQE